MDQSPRTFVAPLRACAKLKDLHGGIRVHARLLKRGLTQNVSDALVSMYAKCGALAKAHQVLNATSVWNVASWTELIGGYAQQGKGRDALNCFKQMQCKGISPDEITLTCVLKACGSVRAVNEGEEIHVEIVKEGLLEKDIALGNALVDMYAKCGALETAQRVLEELPTRDIVSWNSMIAGYTLKGRVGDALNCFGQMQQEGFSPDVFSWNTLIAGHARQGQGHDALECFERMQNNSVSPNAATFSCILKACGNVRAFEKGKQIHDEIARQVLLEKNLVLGNALVNMYAKCGILEKAQQVLEELPSRDVVSWNALLSGYADQKKGHDALNCYEQMQQERVAGNGVTLTCILKACGSIRALDKGMEWHDEILRQGFLKDNVMLGNALVDMYAKCGAMARAQGVFDELFDRNLVSWNALIAGYAEQGRGHDAWSMFKHLASEEIAADEVTFTCILKACGSIQAVDKGEQVHNELIKRGLLGTNVLLHNSLVDMYAKCGALAKAHTVLEEFPCRDVVSWNSLIAGYVQRGQSEKAFHCYKAMQGEGLPPDAVTFVTLLKVCGIMGAAEKGKQLHGDIVRLGMLGTDGVPGSALVDMFVKCGLLEKAKQIVDELLVVDVVSWTALIAGYAQQGKGLEALECVECMQCEGLSPNAVTFSCMLHACSNSGLVEDGVMYFAIMSTPYGIEPNMEHYTCMVDLFGRAGHLDKAVAVIKKMPSSDYCIVWHALMGSCYKWRYVDLGRWAFERALQVDKRDAASYILMSNIYAAADMHEHAQEVELLKMKNEALDVVGSNWCLDTTGSVLSCVGDE